MSDEVRVTLLDRYLQFTGNFLPGRNRSDLLAELRANLQAQMDDRAEEQGRPLSEAEEAVILKQLGHPIEVASRYLEVQNLIAAPWIALYWLVLRLSLLAAATVLVVRVLVGAVLLHATGGWVLGAFLGFPAVALTVFAWVTLSFASISYFGGKYKWLEESEWDPRKLPRVALPAAEQQGKPLSRLAGAIFGLAMLVALRAWPQMLPSAAVGVLAFSPAWHVAYEFLLAASVVGVLAAFGTVIRHHWTMLRPWSGLVSAMLSLAGLRVLLYGGPWVWLLHPVEDSVGLASPLATVNVVVLWSILGAMLGYGIALAVEVWRLLANWRRRAVHDAGFARLC